MRCGQVPGPCAPFPLSSSDDTPVILSPPRARRDAPRGSYNFRETSTGPGKLRRVPAPRVPRAPCWPGACRAAEVYVTGPSAPSPGPTAAAPLLPCLRSLGLVRALPRVRTPWPAGRAQIRMRRLWKVQLETAAVGGCISPGRGGQGWDPPPAGCQRQGLRERAEISNFCTRTRLGTPRAAK